MLSATHSGTVITESEGLGTSAHLISVPGDVKSVIIPDKCIFLKTSSDCNSIPLLPIHTSSLSQHFATLIIFFFAAIQAFYCLS